ncbi:hypothetical protein BV20DRAFT_969789 [Pilatotrama ljubarskyi]|nr:hypothetical protein BV20DRAFT_969789 [Pilatotrama ljubarskyi]
MRWTAQILLLLPSFAAIVAGALVVKDLVPPPSVVGGADPCHINVAGGSISPADCL